jgi:D-3-phosphoglycerate dehydrogenase
MKKILVATDKPFAKVAVDGIRNIVEKSGNELVLLEKYTTHQELIEAAAKADAMIIRSDNADKEVIENSNTLKIIVRAGAGYDNIDLEACTAKGVVAMNTPGQNSNAVAELALGMMVMAARNNYDGSSGTELIDKKLGIHAYGNVGRLVAKIAKGFGMQVYAYDAFVKPEAMKADGVIPVDSAEELYTTCQYISLHIPATAETKQSINFDLLTKMPKGATLVNTARAEVIHESEMIKVMETRTDFKYYSDIMPKNASEYSAEKFGSRYFFTPKKMGAQTSEANINAGLAAANQIVRFFESGDETYKVNK